MQVRRIVVGYMNHLQPEWEDAEERRRREWERLRLWLVERDEDAIGTLETVFSGLGGFR